jgi:hypothetical protein
MFICKLERLETIDIRTIALARIIQRQHANAPSGTGTNTMINSTDRGDGCSILNSVACDDDGKGDEFAFVDDDLWEVLATKKQMLRSNEQS